MTGATPMTRSHIKQTLTDSGVSHVSGADIRRIHALPADQQAASIAAVVEASNEGTEG